MAGSSVTVTTTPAFPGAVGAGGVKEVVKNLACVSDDTNGTVPSQALTDLSSYYLMGIITEPGATYPTTAYRVRIRDTVSGRKLFLGSARTVGATAVAELESGHEYGGTFPSVLGSITFDLVADDGTTEAAANIGNSKEVVVKLRLERK